MAKPGDRAYSVVARDATTLIGETIRNARIERGLSAQAFSDSIGISRALLARIERGEMSVAIGTVFDAATALGIPLIDETHEGLRERIVATRQISSLLPQRAGRKPEADASGTPSPTSKDRQS